MNATGNFKRKIKPTDLVKFPDDTKAREPIDVEKRKAEMLESARLHKAKFWTLIKGNSLDEVKIPDNLGMPDLEGDARGEAIKDILAGQKGDI
jgi:hypothetical protein